MRETPSPEAMVRSAVRLTALLAALGFIATLMLGVPRVGAGLLTGTLTMGAITLFHSALARRFAQPGSRAFPRMLMLSGVVKYPILILIVYLMVKGGMAMVAGFILGVLLPLGVLTVLAVRASAA